MPEGPEVKITTDWLSKTLTGTKIIDNSNFPEINGTYIHKVYCKGKQIFFILIKPNLARELVYLNARLGMTGRWSLHAEVPHIRYWMKVQKVDVNFLNDSFETTISEVTIINTDSRNFGDVELFDESLYQKKLNKIGPDLLSDSIDPKMWMQKLRNPRIKGKFIADYLLEQSYFSGIGNYLKSDILYISKIKPDRTLVSLTDQEIITLLEVSLKLIRESYDAGGLTIKDFWSPEGVRGGYKRKVYNRETDDLGNKIIKECFNSEKVTYWVAEVQK